MTACLSFPLETLTRAFKPIFHVGNNCLVIKQTAMSLILGMLIGCTEFNVSNMLNTDRVPCTFGH
jgi:hypothetical protein